MCVPSYCWRLLIVFSYQFKKSLVLNMVNDFLLKIGNVGNYKILILFKSFVPEVYFWPCSIVKGGKSSRYCQMGVKFTFFIQILLTIGEKRLLVLAGRSLASHYISFDITKYKRKTETWLLLPWGSHWHWWWQGLLNHCWAMMWALTFHPSLERVGNFTVTSVSWSLCSLRDREGHKNKSPSFQLVLL